jgi:lysine/ornithine N-monooxygenase
VYHNVDFVAPPSDGSCWAAAMAIVLNAKGLGSFTPQSVCEQAHIEVNDFKTASDVRHVGSELGLHPVVCNGSTPSGWAQVLHSGPVWAPNPQNDNNVVVIAGVSGSGAEAIIHVVNPQTNFNDWMNFAQFTQEYGFGDGHELLG